LAKNDGGGGSVDEMAARYTFGARYTLGAHGIILYG